MSKRKPITLAMAAMSMEYQ